MRTLSRSKRKVGKRLAKPELTPSKVLMGIWWDWKRRNLLRATSIWPKAQFRFLLSTTGPFEIRTDSLEIREAWVEVIMQQPYKPEPAQIDYQLFLALKTCYMIRRYHQGKTVKMSYCSISQQVPGLLQRRHNEVTVSGEKL